MTNSNFKYRFGQIFFLLFLGSIVFYFGNSHINDDNPGYGISLNEDTTIFVNGQPKMIPIQINNAFLDDFRAFIKFNSTSSNVLITNEVDTTGNGVDERVQSYISINETDVYIQNTIRDLNTGKLLWKDEIEVPREQFLGRKQLHEMTLANNDIIDLYLAKHYANFIGSFFTDENDEDWNRKTLLRSLAGHQYKDLDLTELYSTTLALQLKEYNGKIVKDLNQGYPLYYYWNKDKNQFVPLLIS